MFTLFSEKLTPGFRSIQRRFDISDASLFRGSIESRMMRTHSRIASNIGGDHSYRLMTAIIEVRTTSLIGFQKLWNDHAQMPYGGNHLMFGKNFKVCGSSFDGSWIRLNNPQNVEELLVMTRGIRRLNDHLQR